ncbi:MAG: biotin-dependent carboxyltransferase family protein [Gemmobacter sp.]|uniref:5-oxoprolinase subunit C family protein n=1 Tax=Gemmobacter sp. TaxID=1898957 RepID=UPI003918F0B7
MLEVLGAGPSVTVQDAGRPGHAARGLSRGGAADRLALLEGAALLGQAADLAALELAVMGGRFRATRPLRIALTGAPMAARVGDRRLAWNASHRLAPGEVLELAAVQDGVYGYLSVAGGVATVPFLGSRAAHLAARIGRPLRPGDRLPVGGDPAPDRPDHLLPDPARCAGGTIRLLPTPQTALFAPEVLARFLATPFVRDARGNRQGQRLLWDGPPFAATGHLGLPSEPAQTGDIQMTGDGAPVVLGPECQTTGGYPRIAAIHPADLPRVIQAGAPLRFRMVALAEALASPWHEDDLFAAARATVRPARPDAAALALRLAEGRTGGAVDARGDPFADAC